jgi:hypothetical protein
MCLSSRLDNDGDGVFTFYMGNGKALVGAGPNATFLEVMNNTLPGLVVFPEAFGSNCTIGNFTISRPIAPPLAIDGADGIVVWGGGGITGCPSGTASQNMTGASSQIILFNITSNQHWNGFNLGPTRFSYVNTCIAQNNLNHGFYLNNKPSGFNYAPDIALPIQWELNNTLSQNNHGWGYRAEGYPGPVESPTLALITLSPWNEIYSFGNFLGGAAFVGMSNTVPPAPPVAPFGSLNDCSIIGGWIDNDGVEGGPGIYVNTNGSVIRIINTHIEFSGSFGIQIDGVTNDCGNANVQIVGCDVQNSNLSGLTANGAASFFPLPGTALLFLSELEITGCRFTNNYKQGPNTSPPIPASPYYCGIDLNNDYTGTYLGFVSITATRSGNEVDDGTGSMLFGVQYAGISVTSETFVAACDLTRNGLGGAMLGTPHSASGTNRIA